MREWSHIWIERIQVLLGGGRAGANPCGHVDQCERACTIHIQIGPVCCTPIGMNIHSACIKCCSNSLRQEEEGQPFVSDGETEGRGLAQVAGILGRRLGK